MCGIDLLNFSMGFNIIAPYMEFLHLNWYNAECYLWMAPINGTILKDYNVCKKHTQIISRYERFTKKVPLFPILAPKRYPL